jgi:hypothetical protein
MVSCFSFFLSLLFRFFFYCERILFSLLSFISIFFSSFVFPRTYFILILRLDHPLGGSHYSTLFGHQESNACYESSPSNSVSVEGDTFEDDF